VTASGNAGGTAFAETPFMFAFDSVPAVDYEHYYELPDVDIVLPEDIDIELPEDVDIELPDLVFPEPEDFMFMGVEDVEAFINSILEGIFEG